MPDLTAYSNQRLAQYRVFCETQRSDYSEGTTRNGRMAWLRESKRVEREMDTREVEA